MKIRATSFDKMSVFIKMICMKKILWLGLALPIAIIACNNTEKDSVAKADSANEAKSDSMNHYNDTVSGNGALGVNESTSKFLVDVADVNLTEIQLGRIAQDKASSQRVKDFAAMMVRDHSKASDDLKTLASQKNVSLPTNISEDHQKKMDDLNKKSGRDFDKAYMDVMEDGHEATVKDFEKNTDNSDADVRAFVNKMLPTLRMHRDSANVIKKALK
jgi:putative membrane protein